MGVDDEENMTQGREYSVGEGKGFAHSYLLKEIWKLRGVGVGVPTDALTFSGLS